MARTMQTARKRTGGAKPKAISNLHAAIRKGGTELVKKLISDPKTDVNATDGRKTEFTPLMLACSEGKAKKVDVLLTHPDIDVNAARAQDGVTALMMACSADHDNQDIVRSLLNKQQIDVNAKDTNKAIGYTALMYAADKGYTNVVQALLEHDDIDVNITSTKFGRTALMCAARCGYIETVEALLAHKDIDTKVLNKAAHTAYSLTEIPEIKKMIQDHENGQVSNGSSSRTQSHSDQPRTPVLSTPSTLRMSAASASTASPHTADSESSGEKDDESTDDGEGSDSDGKDEEGEEEEEEEDWVMEKSHYRARNGSSRTSTFLLESSPEMDEPTVERVAPVLATYSASERSKKRLFSSVLDAGPTAVATPRLNLPPARVNAPAAVATARSPLVSASATAVTSEEPVSSTNVGTLQVTVAPAMKTVDTSTSTWLIVRMEQTGFPKKTAQLCHDSLVIEEGFVQESIFAELKGNEIDKAFLNELKITGKGTQLYLMRLHRELRAQYFGPDDAANIASTALAPAITIAMLTDQIAQRPRLA